MTRLIKRTKPARADVLREADYGFIPEQVVESPENKIIRAIDRQKMAVTKGIIDPEKEYSEYYL